MKLNGTRDILQKLEQSTQLLSIPEVYLQLRDLLAGSDYTMTDVALLVGRDPALSARFLQIVNSPLNQRAVKVETVSHAVSLLGSRQVHDIVLSAAVAEAFDDLFIDAVELRKFWQQSVFCAVLAQQLAVISESVEPERLFVMGLLHDIGHLVMLQAIPEQLQQTISTAAAADLPRYQVERELLGFDYAQLGSQLMKDWGLPVSLQVTTRFHPEPATTNRFNVEAALLHLSSQLVRAELENGEFGSGAYGCDEQAWQMTGLGPEQCRTARDEAAEQFMSVAESLFS